MLFLAVDGWTPGHPEPCIWLLNPYALNALSLADRDLITPKNLGYDAGEDYYYDYGELLLEADGLGIAADHLQGRARTRAQKCFSSLVGNLIAA